MSPTQFSTKDTVVDVYGLGVASACGRPQAAPIENGDLPTLITNELAPAQHAGGFGHPHTTHAQHVGHELLSDVEPIGVRPIAGHQQPPRQPRLHHMEARAHRSQRHLAQGYIQIAVQLTTQLRAAFQFAAKWRRLDSQRAAGPLHQRPLWRYIYAEYQRGPQ